jgi:hypothetical protein
MNDDRIEQIKCFLNDPKSVYSIRKENMEDIKRSLDIVTDINNKDTEGLIAKCVEYLEALIIEMVMDKENSDFLYRYSLLLFDWASVNKKDIVPKVLYLGRAANNTLTVSEMNFHLKECVSRLANDTNYSPDTWRLSRHYFSLIEE